MLVLAACGDILPDCCSGAALWRGMPFCFIGIPMLFFRWVFVEGKPFLQKPFPFFLISVPLLWHWYSLPSKARLRSFGWRGPCTAAAATKVRAHFGAGLILGVIWGLLAPAGIPFERDPSKRLVIHPVFLRAQFAVSVMVTPAVLTRRAAASCSLRCFHFSTQQSHLAPMHSPTTLSRFVTAAILVVLINRKNHVQQRGGNYRGSSPKPQAV